MKNVINQFALCALLTFSAVSNIYPEDANQEESVVSPLELHRKLIAAELAEFAAKTNYEAANQPGISSQASDEALDILVATRLARNSAHAACNQDGPCKFLSNSFLQQLNLRNSQTSQPA